MTKAKRRERKQADLAWTMQRQTLERGTPITKLPKELAENAERIGEAMEKLAEQTLPCQPQTQQSLPGMDDAQSLVSATLDMVRHECRQSTGDPYRYRSRGNVYVWSRHLQNGVPCQRHVVEVERVAQDGTTIHSDYVEVDIDGGVISGPLIFRRASAKAFEKLTQPTPEKPQPPRIIVTEDDFTLIVRALQLLVNCEAIVNGKSPSNRNHIEGPAFDLLNRFRGAAGVSKSAVEAEVTTAGIVSAA